MHGLIRRKLATFVFGAGVGIAALTAPAVAATLINLSTPGLYNSGIGTSLDLTNPYMGTDMFPGPNVSTGDPVLNIPSTDEPDLTSAAASLGNWLTTPATPGGTWSGTPVLIPSNWDVNTETAIIYELEGGATGLTDVVASFGVDNGIFVWLNGTFLGGHLRPGVASLGEFVLNIGSVGAGTNHLQVLREDHGVGTGYNVLVTGEAAAIPLPAAGWLLLAGLGALGMAKRRKAVS